jgi:hypothetical protein
MVEDKSKIVSFRLRAEEFKEAERLQVLLALMEKFVMIPLLHSQKLVSL